MTSCHGAAASVAVFRALHDLGWEGQVEEAKTFARRLAGFVALPATVGAGRVRILVFPRCRSVHTWFMRIPLDIAFVDASGRVLARHDGVMPWRMLSCSGAAFRYRAPLGAIGTIGAWRCGGLLAKTKTCLTAWKTMGILITAVNDSAYSGWVAQLVEQRTENPRVRGSIPFPATL